MLISCIACMCSLCDVLYVSTHSCSCTVDTCAWSLCVKLVVVRFIFLGQRTLAVLSALCHNLVCVYCLHAPTFVRRKASNHICGFHIHSQARSSCRRLYMYMCNVCVCDLLSFRFTETFLRCDNVVSQSQRVIRLPRSPDATFLLTLSCWGSFISWHVRTSQLWSVPVFCYVVHRELRDVNTECVVN